MLSKVRLALRASPIHKPIHTWLPLRAQQIDAPPHLSVPYRLVRTYEAFPALGIITAWFTVAASGLVIYAIGTAAESLRNIDKRLARLELETVANKAIAGEEISIAPAAHESTTAETRPMTSMAARLVSMHHMQMHDTLNIAAIAGAVIRLETRLDALTDAVLHVPQPGNAAAHVARKEVKVASPPQDQTSEEHAAGGENDEVAAVIEVLPL